MPPHIIRGIGVFTTILTYRFGPFHFYIMITFCSAALSILFFVSLGHAEYLFDAEFVCARLSGLHIRCRCPRCVPAVRTLKF